MLLSRVNTGIITLGQGLEIDTIAMVVIGGTALRGGKGNILGTLIGVFFLGSIGNAMNMLQAAVRGAVRGEGPGGHHRGFRGYVSPRFRSS